MNVIKLVQIVLASSITISALGGEIELSVVGMIKKDIAIYLDQANLEDLPGIRKRWDKQTRQEKGRRNLQDAVKDLQYYLQKISNSKIQIVTTKPKKQSTDYPILIGERAVKRFGNVRKTSKNEQGWRLVISKEAIGVIGESDEAIAYAIYELLDKMGCRWLMPGEIGEVIPENSRIQLELCDISAIPSTSSRNISGIDLSSPVARDFFRRNRLGGIWLHSQHALNTYITRDELKKHPEWLAQVNGKRELAKTIRLCWSNPKLVKAIATEIIKRLDKHYVSSVSLSPPDGALCCECENCKKLDAGDWDKNCGRFSTSDRLMNFCDKIAREVNKKYPDVVFGLLAYIHYTQPPVREKVNPNIVISIAPITYCRNHSMKNIDCPTKRHLYRILQSWAKITNNVSLRDYGYNLAELSAPNPMTTKWGDDLAVFYDLFKGESVSWAPEGIPSFETVAPGLYLGIRLAFNSKLSHDAVLRDFYEKAYGRAAKPMRKYWRTVDAAWIGAKEHTGSGFGYHFKFTPEVMRQCRASLDKALKKVNSVKTYKRVKIVDDSFRLFELFMTMRRNFLEGKFKGLKQASTEWIGAWTFFSKEYRNEFLFSKYALIYFRAFFQKPYERVDEIESTCDILTKTPIKTWKYHVISQNIPIEKNWNQPGFKDSSWKTTNICHDTWSSLGLHDYFGTMFYRTTIKLPEINSGEKVYLLISASDGKSAVYINGKQMSYVAENGEKASTFTGYCKPAAFEITAGLKAGENLLAISCDRQFFNEIGVGGLMGPVIIYQEK
jgi:hypothetical protein